MNGKTLGIVCGLALNLTAFHTFAAVAAGNDLPLLTSCYFRFLVAEQVSSQGAALTKNLPADTAGQIQASMETWYGRQLDSMRTHLEDGLGDQAQTRFEKFVGDFTQAEKNGDRQRLAEWSQALGLKPEAADYPAFRKSVMDSLIAKEMSDASRFLSEVQTWAGLQGKSKDVPPLEIWLNRAVDTRRAGTPPPRPKEKKPVQNLADAEAATPDLPEAGEEGSSSPLESFAAKRQEKRSKALSEAEAGMQQVAAERQAAEEEYGAKKLAVAQAEAENMKNHAEKLAATEKDALEQRKNSWGSRIKAIVGATVSATTGAFAGGIGARAGEEAVNAIFNDHHDDRH